MTYHPPTVGRLIEALQRLPGIGPKTAQRLTFHLLKQPEGAVRELADALVELKTRVSHCSRCLNVTEGDPCRICGDPRRDPSWRCVVEEPNDLLAMDGPGSTAAGTTSCWGRSPRWTASGRTS